MQEYEEIFNTSKSFNKLPDEFTRKAIKEFVLLLNSNGKNLENNLYKLCSVYPKSIPLNKLTSDDLVKYERTWNNNNARNLFISFLIFSCESGYISDERISRLIDLKDALWGITKTRNNILYILQVSIFSKQHHCFHL